MAEKKSSGSKGPCEINLDPDVDEKVKIIMDQFISEIVFVGLSAFELYDFLLSCWELPRKNDHENFINLLND